MNDVLSKILNASIEVKTAFALAAFGIAAVLISSILSPVGDYQIVIYLGALVATCYVTYQTTRTRGYFDIGPPTESGANIASQLRLIFSLRDLIFQCI